MRTRIISMITLASDKLALIKVGFSVKDQVHQGPKQSTSRQIVYFEEFAAPRKVVQGHVGLYSAIGRDRAC
jgi:hypothetical protein